MKTMWMVTWQDQNRSRVTETLVEQHGVEEPTLQDSPIDFQMQHRAEFITAIIIDTGRTFVLKNRWGTAGEVSR